MVIELSGEGARVVLLPEFGGRLHQLYVTVGGVSEPLLHVPADLERYQVRPSRGGCFPMAPWPNRIQEGVFAFGSRLYEIPRQGNTAHPIHGLVHTQEWEVVARTAAVCEMRAPLGPDWPWVGFAWQRFELGHNAMRMTLEVRTEREVFPAGCGYHPWFRRDVAGALDVHIQMPATKRYFMKDQIPVGHLLTAAAKWDLGNTFLGDRRLDDCYTNLYGPIILDWGRVELEMSVECPTPHVQVYTPPEAFCIEPQTCAPDAFNLAARGCTTDGMAIARPGAPVALTTTWRWSAR